MGLMKEFKEFARVKGNVVDMAVGVIIGELAGTVTSLVDDLIMSVDGAAIGGADLQHYTSVKGVNVAYGKLHSTSVQFPWLLRSLSLW